MGVNENENSPNDRDNNNYGCLEDDCGVKLIVFIFHFFVKCTFHYMVYSK